MWSRQSTTLKVSAKGLHNFEIGDVWKSRSEEVKTFIRSMMSLKPSDRPTASECLNHSWITKIVDEPVDESVTQSALRTLRKFRTNQKLQ